MTKTLLGLAFAIIALFWFFIVEFIKCSTTAFDDAFNFDRGALLVLAVAAAAALGYLVFQIVSGRRNTASMALAVLFVACAGLSFLFRNELTFVADKTFFRKNESEFKDRANGNVAVVKQMSSHDTHKLFLHAGSRSVNAGTVSLETKDALGSALEAFRGCRIVARPLGPEFFLLNVDCRSDN